MKRILALIITICATSHAADWYVGAGIGHASESSSERIGDAAEVGINASVTSQNGIGGGINAIYARGKEYDYPSMNYSNTRSQMYVTPYFVAMKSFFEQSYVFASIGPTVGFGMDDTKSWMLGVSAYGFSMSGGCDAFVTKSVSIKLDLSLRHVKWKENETVNSLIPEIGITYHL